jgi:hypothetical protein
MDIRAFLIDPAGKDWRSLLAYWRPPLPQEATVWFVNLFGEIFVTGADGAIHWLIVGTGELLPLAPSREAFARQLDERKNAEQWLRISLVEGCRSAGLKLAANECYGFKIPPALLGRYEIANFIPTDIASHYSWLSHLSRQEEIYWEGN